MSRIFLILILFASLFPAASSQSTLTIEKIMQGEKFTGFSPEDIQWSSTSEKIYFSWNREMKKDRSIYVFKIGSAEPVLASIDERKALLPRSIKYSRDYSKAVYSRDGDLFMMDTKTGISKNITSSLVPETSPDFTLDEDKIVFTSQGNLYTWEISSGVFKQITDFRPGKKTENSTGMNDKETWLYKDQIRLFITLKERKEAKEKAKKDADEIMVSRPKVIYTGNEQVTSLQLSPDQNFVTYLSSRAADDRNTIVPSYITESGYTEDIRSRSKVGNQYFSGTFYIYDIKKDTVFSLNTDSIAGIKDQPDFVSDYPQKKIEKRALGFSTPAWSGDGRYGVLDIYSDDHKDRWIMLLDMSTGKLKLLDRQRDEAWIGGPGIRRFLGWLPDNRTIYFQSESTGYSHLYSLDVTSGKKTALTSGNFEVYNPVLSKDGKTWYFVTNEDDPGINELYRMPAQGGTKVRLTNFGGGVEFVLSPDEKRFALRVSSANKPWELFILENRDKSKAFRITESTTAEFRSYNWRMPEYVRIVASDGIEVPARLYKPTNPVKNGPAVIFVHGSGYLQNAHRWWSSYFREYMFHNFLADNGYTVLDMDYRGSAGYGRNWRTAIYRHMGGRDLQDHLDGVKFLTGQQGIDPAKIGIYGGSYGGFITLMALFTSPGTFAAGAALRPVTDWAHYNHGYTSNILNTPVADSIAYVKSSPIYYADGLKDHLLICHGMVDDNVHFQDVVRLTQRLIELGKNNWQLAMYPVESHTFVEESSWTDEYKRIFRLFEEELK